MGSETGARRGSTTKEIRFSDKDAGASLPPIPADARPPVAGATKATLPQWAAQAGHIPPPIPRGGYRHRGERFKGFDVRILIAHLRAHGRYVEGVEMTREEYDALVLEARSVSCGSSSAMRDRVEALVPHKGGFVTKEEHARRTAAAAKES